MHSWTGGLIYLTFTAAGVAILGAVPRALQAISGLWTATGGRRKAESDVLDKPCAAAHDSSSTS